MKNKILIALILAMVLVFTFAFVACNENVTVTSITLVDGTFKTEYTVGDKADFSSAKLNVTFSNGTTKEVSVTADMLNKAIDTTTVGENTYTITYKGATVTVTVTVVEDVAQKEYSIETFALPSYITNALDISNTEGEGDANFKVSKRIYEVGNANAFLIKCVATGYDAEDNEVNIDSVKTTYKVEICDTVDGPYSDAPANFVTVEDGYKYFFSEAAAGQFVKLTISLDEEEYFIDSNITASRTITFKVVENGYNVYDQDGLSVMNDNTRPELWADIWGCTADASGNLQPTDNALTLDADTKPLYQYVGNIDWVILHGDITINPDKLPADFFWSKDSTATGFNDSATATIKDKFTTAEEAKDKFGNLLKDFDLAGTLIDGDGYNHFYSIAVYNADNNNNKGIYSTTKVSVSGNYNSITVEDNRTESGRLLKVLVNKTTGKDDTYQQMSQWYLFKMFDPKTEDGWGEPQATFELKNLALHGNSGKSEEVAPQGVSMINTYAKQATIDNVVGNLFYTNLAMDNYKSESETAQSMVLSNSKLYDTYNAMALTWRGAITINNSVLKNSGGPLFVIMDGNSRDEDPNAARPTINVDDKTTLEAFAIGTESWYAQLGEMVPAMFGKFQTLDDSLKLISGKTLITQKTVATKTSNYMNVLAVLIHEAGSALVDTSFDNYKITGKLNVGDESSDMEDATFRQITTFMETYKLGGTVIFKSGSAYALFWKDSTGAQIIISPEMLTECQGVIDATKYWTVMNLLMKGQQPSDASLLEYYTYLGTMCQTWRTASSDKLTIWTQASTGDNTSPYLGIVLGSYHAVDAQ